MILPDVQPVFGFHAFAGHAGADHLGQAVDIDGVHIKRILDFATHGVGPWFGPEYPDL